MYYLHIRRSSMQKKKQSLQPPFQRFTIQLVSHSAYSSSKTINNSISQIPNIIFQIPWVDCVLVVQFILFKIQILMPFRFISRLPK